MLLLMVLTQPRKLQLPIPIVITSRHRPLSSLLSLQYQNYGNRYAHSLQHFKDHNFLTHTGLCSNIGLVSGPFRRYQANYESALVKHLMLVRRWYWLLLYSTLLIDLRQKWFQSLIYMINKYTHWWCRLLYSNYKDKLQCHWHFHFLLLLII